jgi:alpha-D-ribose 1-methylphosphonate 5-triphosphate synthase subunit PhnL
MLEQPILDISGVAKRFTLHQQGDTCLDVLSGVDLVVRPGETVVLDGPSGMGKSTLLKLIYANYRASQGQIRVRLSGGDYLDVTHATPRQLVGMRRDTVGYVSQFLRVIPRVSALDVVAEPLCSEGEGGGMSREAAQAEAGRWLDRLRIPERLWSLPPATFSGGEQQRVNIARSMIRPRPLLLLDEPTASLDPTNSQTVIELIREAAGRGAAMVGIFHDRNVGDAVATRRQDITAFRSTT